MKRSGNILLFFAAAVMEFTWLYAWAMFSTISIAQRGTPLLEAAVLFLTGAFITGLSTGRGSRVISIVLLQTAGFVYAALRTMYSFTDAASEFLGRQWLVEFFSTPHNAMGWLLFAVSLFWAFAFWAGGALLAVRPKTHEKICSRFDLGLAAFLCLLLIKFALLAKGGISINDRFAGPLACIFFFFGLASIGMTRGQAGVSSDPIAGYQRFGIVMGFTCTVFASAISLVAFFQHPLASAARASYGLIKGGASSLGALFVGLIGFMFLPGRGRVIEAPPARNGGVPGQLLSSGHADWVQVAGKILIWLLGTAFGLIMLVIIILSLTYLMKWLFSRTRADSSRTVRGAFFSRATARVWGIFLLAIRTIKEILRGRRTAADFYRALTQWSRLSGIRRRLNETPSEFCARLAGRFPPLKEEISTIVGAFNREIYGEMILDSGEITPLHIAWRKLRSPAHWSLRLKTLFSGMAGSLP